MIAISNLIGLGTDNHAYWTCYSCCR